MTDDNSGCDSIEQQAGVEHLGCRAHAQRRFVDAQKVKSRGRVGRADMALLMINALYRIERDQRKHQVSEAPVPVLACTARLKTPKEKANRRKHCAWLRHVLERLPQAVLVEYFEALLAWNCLPELRR
ncbi:IS66 family transposase [Pseudomonas sp. 21LCFQ010]|uniref:IS66 family transposase n=1 Tax=Pseudomonas sp. 21LCFQ010 TaxID=2957506 RepID=UPI0020983B06|nr:IS66 family transposase [Pseudomonas sp. 21LCFQ010]MCO8165751.1 IS66 family transposase [Pseudomonas sp. 21LCFQ010]